MRTWALIILLFIAGNCLSTDLTESPQQMADIGDLELVSGETLYNARIGYRTAGKLNAERSNVILMPTWFLGSSEDLFDYGIVGSGSIADTDRYFVIVIDSLGNGISSSPSTSSRQSGRKFPAIAIDDMVNAAHALVTRQLGFEQAHAVIGISMGGMQTLQWIAQYPDFMQQAVAIDGSPKMTSYDLLVWQTHVDTIELLQQSGADSASIMRLYARIMQLNLWTPGFFVAHVPVAELDKFIARNTSRTENGHADDTLSQLRAMIAHDVFADFPDVGDTYADRIQAELMLVGTPSDHLVNPLPAKKLAKTLGGRYAETDSDCGHIGTACELGTVAAKVNEFIN